MRLSLQAADGARKKSAVPILFPREGSRHLFEHGVHREMSVCVSVCERRDDSCQAGQQPPKASCAAARRHSWGKRHVDAKAIFTRCTHIENVRNIAQSCNVVWPDDFEVHVMTVPSLVSLYPKHKDLLALTPEDVGCVIIEIMQSLSQNGMLLGL
jgi:hypothetical protein